MCSVHLTGEAVSKETPLAIYGASLETGESGILYHTIGNNGAFYSSYAAIPGFPSRWQHSRRRLLFCRWVRMSRFPPL